jgi:hypothetical protein
VFPGDPNGVRIDAGGIFLALPNLGIVAALPGGYFCQSPGSNLDAILAIDPRTSGAPFPCPMMNISRSIVPAEGLRADPVLSELAAPPNDRGQIGVGINNLDRAPWNPMMTYTLTAVVENPAIVVIDAANALNCAGPTCWCGPCFGPGGVVGAGGSVFNPAAGGMAGQDLCLAEFNIRALAAGTTRITFTITANGPMGPITIPGTDTVVRVTGIAPPPCYPNCDGSVVPPVLNVMDFACFLNRYAAGDPWANCDGSTTPPVLNVLDFSCFLNQFAAGCS